MKLAVCGGIVRARTRMHSLLFLPFKSARTTIWHDLWQIGRRTNATWSFVKLYEVCKDGCKNECYLLFSVKINEWIFKHITLTTYISVTHRIFHYHKCKSLYVSICLLLHLKPLKIWHPDRFKPPPLWSCSCLQDLASVI